MKTETLSKFEEHFDFIKEALLKNDETAARAAYRLALKEVERDTRHKACDLLNEVHNKTANISI